MASRQQKTSSLKPRLTNARYADMVRELEHLNNKYQGHLEKIIPSILEHIEKAKERIERHREVRKPGAPGLKPGGAPELWKKGQLPRLWRLVRALQIADPKLKDGEACGLLAREGFWVWAHDPRSSIAVEDVRVLIDKPETLRRRLAEAKKCLDDPKFPEAKRELEEEARALANHDRIKALLRGQVSPKGVSGI